MTTHWKAPQGVEVIDTAYFIVHGRVDEVIVAVFPGRDNTRDSS